MGASSPGTNQEKQFRDPLKARQGGQGRAGLGVREICISVPAPLLPCLATLGEGLHSEPVSSPGEWE